MAENIILVCFHLDKELYQCSWSVPEEYFGDGGRAIFFSDFPRRETLFPCRNLHFGRPKTNFCGFKKRKAKRKQSSAHCHYFLLPFSNFHLPFYNFPSFLLHFPFFSSLFSVRSAQNFRVKSFGEERVENDWLTARDQHYLHFQPIAWP